MIRDTDIVFIPPYFGINPPPIVASPLTIKEWISEVDISGTMGLIINIALFCIKTGIWH